MRGATCGLAVWTALATASAARAQDIHGRLEIADFGAFAPDGSENSLLGAQDTNDVDANLRLNWAPMWENWSFDVAYVVSTDYGGDTFLSRAESSLLSAPPPTMFDLTDEFENHGLLTAEQDIDRLSIGYSTPDFVVRVGRQALSWGGGLVFRPMDLFDPFAPNATDTDYKPGTDMLYTQWLFADGSDLQAIAVPRPETFGDAPTSNAGSFALHYRTRIGGLDATWLVARDHRDWTTAMELGGPLSGATWDLELVPTVHDGSSYISALANISDAATLFERNATVFAEYFHNGFGVTGADTTFETLPGVLLDRLARGQVFNLRKNYLAAGTTLEWTPLLTVSPTLIADLDDASLYALASATYSFADNLDLIAGAQLPMGPRGTEFGGLHLSPTEPATFGPAPTLYLQLRRYF